MRRGQGEAVRAGKGVNTPHIGIIVTEAEDYADGPLVFIATATGASNPDPIIQRLMTREGYDPETAPSKDAFPPAAVVSTQT